MKKIIVLSLALTLALGVSAQRIGVKLGGNVAGMNSNTSVEGSKALTGLHAGLIIEKKIIMMLSVRGNLAFSQKGYSVKDDVTTPGLTNEYKFLLNYGMADVQAKVKFGPAYIVAGPYLGYAFSGSVKGDVTGELAGVTISTVTDVDVFEGADDVQTLNKMDFGLNVGIGAEFGLGPLHAFAELSYGHGLSNIIHDNVLEMQRTLKIEESNSKNFVIGLSVGVLLGFK